MENLKRKNKETLALLLDRNQTELAKQEEEQQKMAKEEEEKRMAKKRKADQLSAPDCPVCC